jgi:hypothetical protein
LPDRAPGQIGGCRNSVGRTGRVGPDCLVLAQAGVVPAQDIECRRQSGGKGLKSDLTGLTTPPDGTVQVPYAGKRLYYANADAIAGAVSEQRMKMRNTTSYLVSPTGNCCSWYGR